MTDVFDLFIIFQNILSAHALSGCEKKIEEQILNVCEAFVKEANLVYAFNPLDLHPIDHG